MSNLQEASDFENNIAISARRFEESPFFLFFLFFFESTYQHQNIKFYCRCRERVRLKMTLPSVLAENKKNLFSQQKKASNMVGKKVSPKCPGTGSLDSGHLD